MENSNVNNGESFFGFTDDMFEFGTAVPFHKFKTGEHKFRILPPFAPKKLFHKVSIHWGFQDESGRIRALQCSMDYEKKCPICDAVDRMTKTRSAYETAGKLVELKQLDKQISDIRRKPTYLWNILDAEGQQRVLTLSWNGHDPLLNEVKFMWDKSKINVTDPRANWLMYCIRSGEKVKTRYVYKALPDTTKAISYTKLFDLTKVYRVYTSAELANILEDGVASNHDKEPEKQDFVADMTATMPEKSPQVAPVSVDKAPSETKVVNMTASQEADIQNMLAILSKAGK